MNTLNAQTTQTTQTIDSNATTIALLDPTSRDGESALDLLADDENVTLVVLLTGRASNALREYALGEGIHLSTAAWTYLDRVTPRLERHPRRIEHVVANGPDAANELAAVAADREIERIVLPASVARLDPTIVDRLERLTPSPVAVAEMADRR